MNFQHFATGCASPRRLVLWIALISVLVGCRSNPNGGMAWPWQDQNALAGVPQPSSGNPNTWAPPAPSASPWDPNASSGGSADQMSDIMRRQQEQAQLAEEQRRALAQVTEYQRYQAQQTAQMSESRRMEELQKIQQQTELLRNQQQELESLAELRRRSLELDANNRELHAQLAQSQQENRLFEDQTRLLKQQLDDTVARLNDAREQQKVAMQRMGDLQSESQRQYQVAQQQIQMAKQEAEQRVAQVETNLARRGGAKISANSSVQRNLSPISITGLQVRQDGDVIRIELPSDQIFAPGTATLNPDAESLIDRVADAVRQNYSRQIIGIEAHTDPNAIQTGTWSSNHQLSAAQATAVFEQLTKRHQFGVQQLFVLGHGANYPVASNGTPAGQQRNRRVEIVIYPETVDQR